LAVEDSGGVFPNFVIAVHDTHPDNERKVPRPRGKVRSREEGRGVEPYALKPSEEASPGEVKEQRTDGI
jgi:hypothetical protein